MGIAKRETRALKCDVCSVTEGVELCPLCGNPYCNKHIETVEFRENDNIVGMSKSCGCCVHDFENGLFSF